VIADNRQVIAGLGTADYRAEEAWSGVAEPVAGSAGSSVARANMAGLPVGVLVQAPVLPADSTAREPAYMVVRSGLAARADSVVQAGLAVQAGTAD